MPQIVKLNEATDLDLRHFSLSTAIGFDWQNFTELDLPVPTSLTLEP